MLIEAQISIGDHCFSGLVYEINMNVRKKKKKKELVELKKYLCDGRILHRCQAGLKKNEEASGSVRVRCHDPSGVEK